MKIRAGQKLVTRDVVRFALFWVAGFLMAFSHWLFANFRQVTIPQLFFYLHFSSGLISDTDSAFLVTFTLECMLAPTLVATLLTAITLYVNTSMLTHAVMPARYGPTSAVGRAIALLRKGFPLLALIASAIYFLNFVEFAPFVRSMLGEDLFAKRYVDPASVTLQKKALRNLVLIYVESLETTYGNKAIFGEDLLERANALSGTSFASYRAMPGASWTIAAIVGTQCGVPLEFMPGTPMDANANRIDAFLPGATCLGDFLGRFGYHNIFMGSAPLDFTGKGLFFSWHGYQEVYGSKEMLKYGQPAQGWSGWGVYDDDLLRIAREKLLELKNSGQRFNLTILTVDTHQPFGKYSKSCRDAGATKFEDIVRCTSGQLADFVEFAVAHGVTKDTDIVIIGDHLAEGNPVEDELESEPNRRIFNKFVGADLPPKNREDLVAYDLLPSLLELIGIEVTGKRIALGCSAFYPAVPACPKVDLADDMYGHLAISKTYRKLWSRN